MAEAKLVIAAKRISNEMIGSLQIGKSETTMGMFLAFDIALLIIYESFTGRRGNDMKPEELLKWAKELPNPTENVIGVN